MSQTGPSGTGYYDFDASGNTVGITGASGTYVNQYSYLPFGETTTVSAALPNPFTFAGQVGVMQIGTNLFYMRARDYTPATGQFLSNDPLGLGRRRHEPAPLRLQQPHRFYRSCGLGGELSPRGDGHRDWTSAARVTADFAHLERPLHELVKQFIGYGPARGAGQPYGDNWAAVATGLLIHRASSTGLSRGGWHWWTAN